MDLTQSDLARALGMTTASISMILSGRVIKTRKWKELASALQIEEAWMIDLMNRASADALDVAQKARKERAEKEALDLAAKLSIPASEASDVVPVLGESVPGSGGRYVFGGKVLDILPRPPMLKGVTGAYATFVDGVEMYPRYKPGETLWLHPSRPARPGDDVMVQTRAYRADKPNIGYLRQLVDFGDGEVRLAKYSGADISILKLATIASIHVVVFASKY